MQSKQPIPSYKDKDKSILPAPTFVTTESHESASTSLLVASTSLSLETEPAFLDDEGPSTETPPHVSTTNIRELYGWEPGDSLDEAIARSNTGG